MNEEKTQLRSCPFCGETPRIVTRNVEPQGDPWYGRKDETFVLCDCGACLFDGSFHEGFYDAETRAVEAWNRRASPSVNEEKTEACRAEQRGPSEWVCDCAGPGPNCKPTRADGVTVGATPSPEGFGKMDLTPPEPGPTRIAKVARTDGVQEDRYEPVGEFIQRKQPAGVESVWEPAASWSAKSTTLYRRTRGVEGGCQHTNGDHPPLDSGTPSTPIDGEKNG